MNQKQNCDEIDGMYHDWELMDTIEKHHITPTIIKEYQCSICGATSEEVYQLVET